MLPYGTYNLRRRLKVWFDDSAHPDKKTQKLLDQHRDELLGETSNKTQYGFFRAAWRLIKPYWFTWNLAEETNIKNAWNHACKATLIRDRLKDSWDHFTTPNSDQNEPYKNFRDMHWHESGFKTLSESWDIFKKQPSLKEQMKGIKESFGLLKMPKTAKEKAVSWMLLVATLGLTYYNVQHIAVAFNNWNQDIGNLVQESFNAVAGGPENVARAMDSFKTLIADLANITGQALLVGATNYKVAQHATLRWRKWMRADFEDRWMKNKAFYRMQFLNKPIDNPDQRIQEDPARFTQFAVDVLTDALDAVISFATFSTILWGLSNDLNLATLGGPDIVIPKFMFTAVMAYSALGTLVTYYQSKPQEKRSQEQQMLEGTYRSDLKEVHEKAEPIALNDAEKVQKGILSDSFNKLYDNYKTLINIKTGLLVMRVIYNRIAGVVPLVVTFPQLVDGTMKIGGVYKTMGAFGEVRSSMSWYVNNASTVREGKANMNRLIELDDVLTKLERENHAREISVPPEAPTGLPVAPTPSVN